MAKIEFYVGDADKYIAVLDDGAVPREGEYVNIQNSSYQVRRVTWAVDHADKIPGASLRANVILALWPPAAR